MDDLVTDTQVRSQNYGHQLLDWLIQYARNQECTQFHLDSGLQRLDAHRFYQRVLDDNRAGFFPAFGGAT